MLERHNLSLRLVMPFALLFLVVVGVVFSLPHAETDQPAATYTRGNLSVTIPYHSVHLGTGKLVTEILDPEDHVLGRAERSVEIASGDGSWQQVIVPEKSIPYDDIVWQRMRYRFEYSGSDLPPVEGIESISQILRRPVVHILAQTKYLVGSEAAIRVIVSAANNNDIAETGTLHVELRVPNQKAHPLFSGRLNRHGSIEAQFRFPIGLVGKYDVRYVAETPIGTTNCRTRRQSIYPPHHGKAHLPTWPDHSRPRARAQQE